MSASMPEAGFAFGLGGVSFGPTGDVNERKSNHGHILPFGTHLLVRGLGFIAPISPPVTSLIWPAGQVPSSTRTRLPVGRLPSVGSLLRTCDWAAPIDRSKAAVAREMRNLFITPICAPASPFSSPEGCHNQTDPLPKSW